MPVPDLPGDLVPKHSPHESWLKTSVARLCQLENERCALQVQERTAIQWSSQLSYRFPGSQPVSFGTRDLLKLENQEWVILTGTTDAELLSDSFWVCEKSDGIRVLLLILFTQGVQKVFLVRNFDPLRANEKVDCFRRSIDTTLTASWMVSSFPTTKILSILSETLS